MSLPCTPVRRIKTAMVFVLVFCSVACGHRMVAGQENQSPHIVLVMADDQGWGQTSYNGHPLLKTPNLDAMASGGLRFDRFYAAAPVCSPTRAAVLTGRTNRRTGVESHGFALRRQEKTLAQALADKGYATGHFGKWHLNGLRGPGVPILTGDSHHPGHFGFQTWVSVSNFFDRDPILSRMGEFEEYQGDSSELAMAEAIEFIRSNADKGKPTFTVVWFGTPHSPFRSTQEDTAPFERLEKNSRNQLGELVALDRSIGALQDGLTKAGIRDNTLVWYTSDNGGLKLEPSTTGGLRGHKSTMWEGGLRVPGIIQWPAKIQPRISKFPAVSMDILPTIAEIVGLDKSTWIEPQDGISLVQLFDQELSHRDQVLQFHCLGNSAVIDNDIKLIRLQARGRQPERYELFNLRQDPLEQDNLIDKQPELAARMKNILKVQTESVQRSIEGKDYPEGKVLPGHPEPRQWTEVEAYRPYFEQWKSRPEYESRIKSLLKK